MSLPVLILLILGCAASAFAAYWLFLFRRLLPLERRLGGSIAAADDLGRFTLELMEGGAGGLLPQTLSELGHRALSCLHARMPDVHLWWIVRREGERGSLVAHRGGAWALPGADGLRFDSPALREAWERGVLWDLMTRPEAGENPFLKSLAQSGICRVRILPWGRESGAGGLLAAGVAVSSGRRLEQVEPYLAMAARVAGFAAQVVERLSGLTVERRSLEGGLSDALQELSEAQARFIRKSREVRTLHEVAQTLAAPAAQSQSALKAVVSIVAKYLEADLVAFLLLDESTGELVTQPGAYGLEGSEMLYRIPLTNAESSSARVFNSGEAFISGDAQNDPQVISHYTRLWRINSLIAVPLRVGGRVIGVLRVGKFKKDAFGKEHLDLVRVIADEAAVLVETAVLNRKLTDSAEQMTELNRMKDEFVSTVSHEFKTPLTTIMGFVTVMLEGETGSLTLEQKKFLGIVGASAKRLAGLVADLLDISRLEGRVQMEMKEIALEKIVAGSVENHRPHAEASGRRLDAEMPADVPAALGDERWISVVMDNLISNAVKFTREGGRVRVALADKGEFLMVSVEDDGIGIPSDDRERIFEKFYRASNRTEVNAPGTGLGLAIAKEVVSKHGGKIWFESEPGRGTKFYFIIPTAKSKRLAAEARE